ncbi:hypothetical protein AVEN_147354-1 [Araneus ventricosus]|uniref:Uncharacterized protein n=1 Tax=Araneus ventricosus TaxID=182803 RepID=A0A4Y1ZSU4_ARAVE|nr:hypothetical protein AVEN_147354-1 [Araneus ventricosus]
MTVTALSIALRSPAFQLALQTKLQSPPSFRLNPFIYPCSTGRVVTWKNLVHSSISSPNRDIEKMFAFSGIFELSPKSPNWFVKIRDRDLAAAGHSMLTLVKLSARL